MKWLLLVLLLAPVGCAQNQAAAPPVNTDRAKQLWKAGRYDEANTTYRELVKANPKSPDVRVEWGRLFLERFQPADAADLFNEALEIRKDHPGALLGLALVAADGFENKAVELAQKALKADPKLLEAQELLARLALEDSNPKKAIEEADKALAISPDALQAMAIRATIDWLEPRGKGIDDSNPWIKKVLAKSPNYGEAYETAAHFFVLNRRYEEGIALYRKAIELKPALWRARSQLGIQLMRLGDEEPAREQLELSYRNGHKDAATVNTLRLMDSYKNFVTYKAPGIIVRLHKKESEVLKPFFIDEMERCMRTYEKKYKVKLPVPVQIEVYPDHEDFAVRTMGMPGLGALGVTFGTVVAMDSPSGRRPGSFHWATTLWHEMSHVYVLTATKHKVPRWFTEGMAVHEETAIYPDWGDRLDPNSIAAIKGKKLLPVAELDRGFIRPTYPAQVVVSYFQAGRICDYINKKWGFDKLLGMMNSFGEGASTPEAIKTQLGIAPEEFDKEFLAALEAETKVVVEGYDSWRKQVRSLNELVKAEKHDDVIREGLAIRDIYPEYVEPGNVYEALATAYEAKGNKAEALKQLIAYSKAGGRHPETIKKLAAMLDEAGRPKEAIAALERLNFIHPIDEELQVKLGGLYLKQGNPQSAIRPYQALVAMKPTDAANAHFQLAQAYHGAGKTAQAKDELLVALEAAPGFRPAQKLLLELTRGESK